LSLDSPCAPPFTEPLLARYLERYAEPEARLIAASQQLGSAQPWACALVVPALGEHVQMLEGYEAAFAQLQGRGLLIVVLNAHADVSPLLFTATQQLQHALLEQCAPWTLLSDAPRIGLGRHAAFDVLLVERWEERFQLPMRGAVGHARKLGNDIALALLSRGLLRSPWLYQSDADARLPAAALSRSLGAGEGARLFPFRHVAGHGEQDTDERIVLATLQYEVHLRYHVLGLEWAGSPYAFHALGSCIVVHARTYLHVRGFPKRAAGEDFYLLQKIRKLAPVVQLTGEPVELRARLSARTPFGTGKAVTELLDADAGAQSAAGLRFESAASYRILRGWLGALERYARTRDSAALGWDDGTQGDLYTLGRQVLLGFGARERLTALLREAPGDSDLLSRAHTWFDGLKTQRFLHGLRAGTALCSLPAALATAPFGTFDEPGADLSRWRALSTQLEGLEGRLRQPQTER
jgi:hypothetical protein